MSIISDMVQLLEAAGTPDTRDTHFSRAQQIEQIAKMLEAAKQPPNPDPENHLATKEGLWHVIYTCTHNDVVDRAVAAAKKIGGWAASTAVNAAEEREQLNKLRAANAKKYKK